MRSFISGSFSARPTSMNTKRLRLRIKRRVALCDKSQSDLLNVVLGFLGGGGFHAQRANNLKPLA
jgi:hypothetical protein